MKSYHIGNGQGKCIRMLSRFSKNRGAYCLHDSLTYLGTNEHEDDLLLRLYRYAEYLLSKLRIARTADRASAHSRFLRGLYGKVGSVGIGRYDNKLIML